ncbi:MAG: leucine--tRNA ligase [Proteobacteria bacterium]|nr:MAG: leucine--tRNA ligase [Pseudomonadota bacterium]
MDYKPKEIEKKWQDIWLKTRAFEPSDDRSLPKKYILSMFPYPSGRIHMGHVRNYSIGDSIARFYKKQGYNVLHPIGWDSFGMPAENAAIKHKTHPKKWTYENIDYMRRELNTLGFSFSKEREFATSDELYTKHEQGFFIDMYEKGLVYRRENLVNWCDDCDTVLANEQVEEGCCWRCGNEVIQKQMQGYYLKITKYADELLDDLKELEGKWPKQVLTMQENWIGKSNGLEFEFELDEESKAKLDGIERYKVFTTRPDTIFGVTYSALAPEHQIVKTLIKNGHLRDEIVAKIVSMCKLSSRDKQSSKKEGYDLGINVIHPLTGEKVPVWVANFVLIEYGGGAVMAVPAHDERDFEFASEFGLPIRQSIKPSKGEYNPNEAYAEPGILVNSGEFTGLKSKDAIKKIIYHFEQNNLGKKVTNYKLRDWGISRQRYWGAPIPMVHCSKCGLIPEKKENLPIALPENVEITGSGNPLDNAHEWKRVTCPKCGCEAVRESDTMDTFFQSSWYFLRYASNPKNWENEAFNKEDVAYWLGVDQYIGGIEHAIMHLLYARFFTKVLRDFGYVDIKEPFERLLTQGMVLKDGSKMSKSKGNTVDPDEIIEKYGADTARLFILFAAPAAKELEWNDDAVEGAYRFIKRFCARSSNAKKCNSLPQIEHKSLNKKEKYARKKVYEALQKSYDMIKEANYAFNTLVAACMEALNALNDQENEDVWTEGYFILLNVLEPIIPHVCWELSDDLFAQANFAKIPIKEECFEEDELTLALTINGKRRAEIMVDLNASKDEILSVAKEQGAKWLEGKNIIKEIYVPNKLVNIVVK